MPQPDEVAEQLKVLQEEMKALRQEMKEKREVPQRPLLRHRGPLPAPRGFTIPNQERE